MPVRRRVAGFLIGLAAVSGAASGQDILDELDDLVLEPEAADPGAELAQEQGQGAGELFDEGLDELLGGDAGPELAADAGEREVFRGLQGEFGTRLRSFFHDRNRGRNDTQHFVEGELELDLALGADVDGYFRPRFRVDLEDPDGDRFEPYEAYVTYGTKGWDLRAGLFVENWGIADTFNPIDVVNRRDFGNDFLDPDRLGELGLRWRRFFEGNERFGEPTLSLYALPAFRRTVFPGEDSRFSLGSEVLPFDEDAGVTPHGADRGLYAARYQSTLDTRPFNADLQLLAARGPDRFPLFIPRGGALAPFYHGTFTVGGGLRAVPNEDVLGEFASTLTLKAEVAYKAPYRFDGGPAAPDEYLQFVFGVDRVFPNVFGDTDQVTLTLEYAAEEGASDAASDQRPFGSDLIVRAFWEGGDFSRTSLEGRALIDLDADERIYEVLFERQLRAVDDDLKWTLQWQQYEIDEQGSLFAFLPDNSFVGVGLLWEF